MVKYYPVHLDLAGRKCLVVGGGQVAERKIKSLLECGARVFVVSPEINAALEELKNTGQLNYLEREYRSSDVEGAFLVVAATDNEKLNQKIANDCFKENILINVVDDPVKCNFIVPSVIRRGALTITVSTGGKSPMLARKIREDLEKVYGSEYAEFLELMGRLRDEIKSKVPEEKKRRQLFEMLVNSDILGLLKEGQHEAVKERIKDVLGYSWSQS